MHSRRTPSLVDLFLAAPMKSLLLSVGPILLAIGQLANSYVNGFSPTIAIGFTVVMVAFAVVATGHHAAEYRLSQLERECRASK